MIWQRSQTPKKLIEDDSKRVILNSCYVAEGFLARARGLLGKPELDWDEALYIPKCNGVHTWFMSYPIDVVFLDRDWRALRCVSRMTPWKMKPLVWKARGVLELREGSIEKHDLREGGVYKCIS
jgi:hypothetical protein